MGNTLEFLKSSSVSSKERKNYVPLEDLSKKGVKRLRETLNDPVGGKI